MQVACLCGFRQRARAPFFDLSLPLGAGVRNLEDALAQFFKMEVLDKENKWLCAGCHRRVCAQKELTVRHAPRVLTIQLKRFNYGRQGRKIGDHVAFPVALSLNEARAEGGPVRYGLMGVLVHSGPTLNGGHFSSFVRAPNGVWHHANDAVVQRVSAETVTSQCAYLLFYGRGAEIGLARVEVPRQVPAGAPVAAVAMERLRARSKASAVALDAKAAIAAEAAARAPAAGRERESLALTCDTGVVDFGAQLVSTRRTREFRVFNTGDGVLRVHVRGDLLAGAAAGAAFTVLSPLAFPLAVGASAAVVVVFTPGTVAAASAPLVIEFAGCAPVGQQAVTLTLSGQGAVGSLCVKLPRAAGGGSLIADLGAVRAGGDAALPFTVLNDGCVPVSFAAPSAGGVSASQGPITSCVSSTCTAPPTSHATRTATGTGASASLVT